MITAQGRDYFRAILSRAAMCGKGQDVEYAASRYGERIAYLTRSAVAAGGVSSGGWGDVLATPEHMEFFGAVEQASVVGRLGLRPVALSIRTLLLADGASAYWVGRGESKAISKMNFDGDTLMPMKIASVYVVTKELVRAANVRAEQGLRVDLIRVLGEAIDVAFLDPSNIGFANKIPASVTSGVSPLASTGSAEGDVAQLIASFIGDLLAAAFVTDPTTAAQLGLARGSAGVFSFPDAGPRGGSILGIPLIVSRSSPRDSTGGQLALIDGSGIAYGSEGVRSVASDQATIEMADDPEGATAHVSLFQTNSVAILSEIGVNWKVIRDSAVAYVEGVEYPVFES